MNIEEKIKEIETTLKNLNEEKEKREVQIKLLTKSVKEYKKLLEKAKAIQSA